LFYNAYDWSKGNREINTWTGMPQTLTLPYNQNHLTFSFVGIDMKSSDKVRYKFMLEGEEDEWSPAVAKNEVTYSALAPGTYTFKVKSCNSDGIWNEDALSYTFTINPPWWRTFWFKAVGVVSIIVIIFLIFKWRTRSLLNKQRQLEKVIEERTQEITQQRDEIEEKQKEILDSINYAKRLQQAILAPLDEITRHLANNFLLYLPKDIVAGDFYFFEITENHIFIAAADCTGHGVPGALVSIVCSNALSRSVNEFSLTEPGKILDKTREMVIDTFKKSGQDVKDGMDISFIAINRATNEVSWSGSNNPLWIYQNGKMEEITANKQPIGISDKAVAFTTHKLKVASGDTLFLFTDGYADQFGGPKGKKFKYSNMQELLIEINDLTMSEQLKKLHAAFNLWKGDLEQVDDVCIIGIKL
jgi:serine phosphatase RsbU (regulator of sigma subunit)